MDSVSQLALGAAIGEATLGRKLGRSAMVLGGALGTLPDLDVLVHYTDAVESFTYHRSWSHSIFTLTALSFLLAWLFQRFYPDRWIRSPRNSNNPSIRPRYSNWLAFCWLILITHPILDGFTIYGTQLLWPLPTKPVAWGSIFIIDPLYTLPILIGLWIAWRSRHYATRAVAFGLLVSTLYIGVTLISQKHARNVAMASLEAQGLATANVLIAPAPFAVLWRIVSMDVDHYHEGFYSVFDADHTLEFDKFASGRSIVERYSTHWPIAQLDWFTRGMLSASPQNDRLIINDLRMGVETSYVFRFDMGSFVPTTNEAVEPDGSTFDAELKPEITQLLPLEFNYERMRAIARRVWDESTPIPTQ